MKRLRVGVVGAGAWGRNHVRTVAGLAEAELAAVCDTDPKVREKVARQYPAALVTADVRALLGAVDAVIVASPAATHATIAQQAVEAGKPVLVEKPFALNGRDAEAIARRSAERKVPVLAGHLLVYHPAVERLRELVQTGELGKLFYLYGLRVNLGQVRKDENATVPQTQSSPALLARRAACTSRCAWKKLPAARHRGRRVSYDGVRERGACARPAILARSP